MTAPDEKRLQLLTDAAYEVGSDDPDLLDAIRERLNVTPGGTAYAAVLRLLQAAAWRNPDVVAGYVHDLFERVREQTAHDCTTDHHWCCGGSCGCRLLFHGRCESCQSAPGERVDQALRDLVALLTECTSERAIRDTLGGAA